MGKAFITIHNGKNCRNCLWLQDIEYLGEGSDLVSWQANSAVVAVDEHGHPIGIWKFAKAGSSIWSSGTWVLPKLRKHGIAKKLWAFGISYFKPKSIHVTVISDRGYSLVCAIRDMFPHIKWNIQHEGLRKSIRLKDRRNGKQQISI